MNVEGVVIKQKELENFLRTMQQAVRKYSLSELNDTICTIINSKNNKVKDRQTHIEVVMDVICDDFQIQKEAFLIGRGKGKVQQARKFAFCILHNDLDLPIRSIANLFSMNWHTSVMVVIKYHKTLNKEIKPDREFLEKLQQLQSMVKQKLNDKI